MVGEDLQFYLGNGAITVFLIALVGLFQKLRENRTTLRKAKAEAESDSGQLSFNIAKDLRDRVRELESHSHAQDIKLEFIRRAWWQHGRWDDTLVDHLRKAGVDVGQLPPRPELPFD